MKAYKMYAIAPITATRAVELPATLQAAPVNSAGVLEMFSEPELDPLEPDPDPDPDPDPELLAGALVAGVPAGEAGAVGAT
jgi:hypothetical protein